MKEHELHFSVGSIKGFRIGEQTAYGIYRKRNMAMMCRVSLETRSSVRNEL